MAWTERIRDADYTSASGTVTKFDYEVINNTPVKKTSFYTFGNTPGAFGQNFGLGARTFAIRAYITGADYDTTADAFSTSLEEAGTGFFTHPLQGRKTVIATTISRRDDLVKEAGQAVFDLTLVETLTSLFPSPSASQGDLVRSSINSYDTEAPINFNDTITLETSSETANFETKFDNSLNATFELLSRTMSSDTLRDFESSINGIKNGLGALTDAGEMVELASQTIASIRFATDLNDLSDLTSSLLQPTTPTVDNEDVNNKSIDKLFSFSSVITMANSTLDTDFKNRGEAIDAAVFLEGQQSSVTDWNFEQNASVNAVNADNSYSPFFNTVTRESGRLVADTFDLPIEQFIVLDKARSVIDLSSELYDSSDISFVNNIVYENNLIGDEVISVPAGKTIRFYR